MEWFAHITDFFIHLDHHINSIVEQYGTWTYLILFLIIFCETGLVVTPFLPGDSLLFVVGALSASGGPLKIQWVLSLLIFAAVAGDNLNYFIGHLLAPGVFRHENIRFVKKEYLTRTEHFYAKYGAKANIIAVWTFGAASGLRPIASAAFAAILPIDKAGAIVPTPIIMAMANNFIDSGSIIFYFLFN